ncbi:superinfection immunity protein [Millisia brevis]|uniref:superinfection immunity protein n=1 Tax=Millisia brevis TaxID=264148 RepID=UPI00082B1509|nr:superinfection immunity protein [Millisia brevis]
MVNTLVLADDLVRPSELFVPAVALVIFGLLYLTPTIVALLRRVPETGTLAAINLFLGWTVIGWIAAMIMAAGSVDPHRRRRQSPSREQWSDPLRHHGPITRSQARRYGEGDSLDDRPFARDRH